MVMHIIVLIFEILYYSMFMKFTKKEGKFWKYLLLFTLITIVGLFIGTNNFISYLILVLMVLYGLKYIVKSKTNLYDMLWIILMLLIKIIIETPTYIFVCFFTKNLMLIGILSNVIKILFVFAIKRLLNNWYLKLKKIWDNNNFYLRYIFTCLVYVYVIITLILFIIIGRG